MKVCRELAAAGQTIVLVEQNLAATLALAQRVYIINNGHIVHEGPAEEIKAQPQILLAQRVYIINNGHIVHEGPAEEIKGQPQILQRYLGL